MPGLVLDALQDNGKGLCVLKCTREDAPALLHGYEITGGNLVQLNPRECKAFNEFILDMIAMTACKINGMSAPPMQDVHKQWLYGKHHLLAHFKLDRPFLELSKWMREQKPKGKAKMAALGVIAHILFCKHPAILRCITCTTEGLLRFDEELALTFLESYSTNVIELDALETPDTDTEDFETLPQKRPFTLHVPDTLTRALNNMVPSPAMHHVRVENFCRDEACLLYTSPSPRD